jgi:hypothetical protein
MVKNIVIAVLIVISLFTTVYAINKQTEARLQAAFAAAKAQQAKELMKVAKRAQKDAANQMAAAAVAKAEIERQLKLAREKCK